MPRFLALAFTLAFAASLASSLACRPSDEGSEQPVEVTAIELHRSFRGDPRAALEEFEGKDLVIVGEVARAVPRFRGTTMSGEVTVPAQVMFKTDLDTLPTDIKYVQVEGRFDAPDSIAEWALDPRIQEGKTLRVSCPRAEIRWTDPGLYVSDCWIAVD
jgi:hypothetical protein